MRMLVVEDEIRLADAIAQVLENEKYDVDIVHDGESAIDYAMSETYDLIILDVMLPKKNGYEVAKLLRQNKISVHIIMLTAKDETKDKVLGLDSGADDYMTKPFEVIELLARVRALTRRQGEIIFEELCYEDVTLDLSNYLLKVGGKNVQLSHKEFELMRIFLSSPRVVLSKENLITKVWGYDSNAEDNNVEVYVSFLRKKLAFLESKTTLVTIRKLGYKLDLLP